VAEQVQPIRRKVALKVLKPGMETRQVVARFDAERQALALMDHPNIAQIHDGGTTPDGRPFFVMELVKGIPLTDYCDRCNLPTHDRLELLLSVCHAVQHAHQKGVIHRDLKPSNVLVAIQDGKPAAKVIDFGIAKAINQRLSEHTLATGFHQMIGTPLYMSPEQAELSPLDVDTRSDIYALGVLLYELLTGTTPLEKERLSKAGYDELRRLIREEEPPTPSARLSTLQDQLTAVAAQRRTDPRQLLRTVRGELDWVVMKCLDKDRNRRYETANGLAHDIERYLANEPVQACPPSAWYRASKFARRNKGVLATAVLAAGMLLAATVGALVYAAQQQRLAAEQKQLLHDREQFSAEQAESLRQLGEVQKQTEADLYQALLRQSAALREGQQPGYRALVWANLHRAAELPACNPDDIRREVLACLGAPTGLEPAVAASARRAAPPRIPEQFRQWLPNDGKAHTAVAPSEKYLAVVGFAFNAQITLWGEGGKVLARAEVPLGGVRDLTFTPDGRFLVAGCEEGVALWAVPDLRLFTLYRGPSASSVAAQPGGPLIASAGLAITLWSLRSNRPVATLKQPSGTGGVEFSADGKLLLAVKRDKVLAAWSVGDAPEKLSLAGHEQGVPGVAFSLDGKLLASVGKDCKVKIWDARSGALLHTGEHETAVDCLAFSPDGTVLASGDYYGVIRLWDPATGKEIGRIVYSQVRRLQFDASGRFLAAAGSDGVAAWAIRRAAGAVKAEQFLFLPKSGVAYDLAVHPAGTGLVWRKAWGGLRTYDLTRARWREFPGQPWQHLRTLHFDPAGTQVRFVTGAGRFGAAAWPGGQPVSVPGMDVRMLAGGPDGRWLATPDRAAQGLIVYDLESGREWATLPPQGAEIWALGWSPDGTRLAAGLADGGVVIWDLEQVRARLADFGLELPSTATRSDVRRPPPLSAEEFEWMVKFYRPDTEPGDARQRLEGARRAVELSPQSVLAWQVLGWARYRAGSWKASIEALEKSCALQEYPKGGDSAQWFFLAMAHWQLGEKDKASQRYHEATAWMEKEAPLDEHLRRFQAEAAELMGIAGLARGRFYAERGQWDKAAADFALAFEHQVPADPSIWFEHAFLRLQVGDVTGYRTLCLRMGKQFGESTNVDDIALLAHVCVLGEGALDRPASVVQLAQKRLRLTTPPSGHHGASLHVMALAHYRAGQHELAIQWLNQALKEYPSWEPLVIPNYLGLTLAHHRLGHAEEARKWFDKAQERIEALARTRGDQPSLFAPPGWQWRDWLGIQMVRREAAQLLLNEREK
jgi:WD40 repeat protein